MKRTVLLSAFAALVVPFSSFADEETVGNYTWTFWIEGDSATVERVSPASGRIAIPSILGGKTVTTIADNAFSGCSGLTSISIPDSVTSIGNYAFRGCSNLRSLAIPDSVTSIGRWAFSDCSGLASLVIPDGVTSIGEGVFSNCSGLKTVSIPESVTFIAWGAFEGCSRLVYASVARWYGDGALPDSIRSVTIPEGVTSIGYGAFSDCSNLQTITIPDSVTRIENNAFRNCSNLQTITIPDSVTEISSNAFNGCNRLVSATTTRWINGLPDSIRSVTIPDGVWTIDESAFRGCSGLMSITIPDGVTSIGEYAFADCSGLTSVMIPDSLTSIGNETFRNCSGLTTITIPEGVTSIGYGAFRDCSNLQTIAMPGSVTEVSDNAFDGCNRLVSATTARWFDGLPDSIRSITIPDSVTSIGDCAFADCSGLSSITIPEGVTSIGYGAFRDCSNLQTITIPDSVTSIGNSAFYGCSGLTSITIPISVTSIGIETFRHCSGLTTITIPEGVTSIGYGAFRDCSNLQTITIPISVTNIGGEAFEGCSGLMSVTADPKWAAEFYSTRAFSFTVADGVTSIANQAFSGCSRLTSISIPDSVTSIGALAFDGCSGLTSVTIPNSVTSVGDDAFTGCSRLTSVTADPKWGRCFASAANFAFTIPDGVTHIENGAFYHCFGLTSVTIPNSVVEIGEDAFSDCTQVENVMIPGRFKLSSVFPLEYAYPPVLTNVVVSPGSTFIAQEAFYRGCSSVLSVAIPDGVTSIGSFAFVGCTGLKTIEIPGSVTNIGDGAFHACHGLEYVEIPENVSYIGPGAFEYCSSLESIVVRSGNRHYCDVGGVLYTKRMDEIVAYPTARTGGYAIPGGVSTIGARAFYVCERLSSIAIPETVTSIGFEAFCGCRSLSSLEIPESVTNIEAGAFSRCFVKDVAVSGRFALSTILPDSYQSVTNAIVLQRETRIGDGMFSGCSALASVEIPGSVTNVGENAFSGCGNLADSLFGENGSTLWFVPPSVSGTVVLPGTVSRIGDHALSYNAGNVALLVVPDDCVFDGENAGVSGSTRIVRYADYFFDILTAELQEAGCGVPYRAEFETTAKNEDNLSWRILDASDGDAYSESGLPPGLFLSGGAVEGIAERRGDWRFAVEAVNEFGLARTNWISLSVVSPGEGALEWDVCSDIRWRTGGDVRWSVPDGGWFAESGEAGDGEETWIEASVRGPGVLSFEWRVSCENRNDSLQLFVDGVAKSRITGETDWRTHSVAVGPGRHAIRWVYAKNGSVSEGEDRAWLGSVEWTPSWPATENGFPEALETDGLDWWTSGDAEWIAVLTDDADDGTDCAWSGAVENGGVSRIETTVSGAGTLSFDLFVSGRQGIDWLDVFVDDEPAFSRTGEVPWTRETIELEAGDHVIAWEWFRGDYDAPESGFDQAGLDQVSWTPAKPTSVVVEGVEIPVAWFDENAAAAVAAAGGDYEAAAKAMAANGENQVWECYVNGVSPTNAAERFEVSIGFENGEPVVTWTPDLNEGGTKSERVYTVEGKADLGDETWGPTNESTRFFRVKVEMP